MLEGVTLGVRVTPNHDHASHGVGRRCAPRRAALRAGDERAFAKLVDTY
jgi:hypothetical protein